MTTSTFNDEESLLSGEDEPAETMQSSTDEEILMGDVDQITGDRLLQVAGSLTNKEILAMVNGYHSKEVLAEKVLTNRLNQSFESIVRLGRQRQRSLAS